MNTEEIIIDDEMDAVTDRGITILTPLQDMSLDSSVASINDETIESIDVTDNDITIDDEEDDIEVLQVTSGVQTRSGRMFAVSNVKCQNCRQSNPKCFTPADGVGNENVVNSSVVNIILDTDGDVEEDADPLQYIITDFSIYCKSDNDENHLVPVFADNLLIAGKKIYLSGKVLRLDCQEDDEGLQVNTADMDGNTNPALVASNAEALVSGNSGPAAGCCLIEPDAGPPTPPPTQNLPPTTGADM